MWGKQEDIIWGMLYVDPGARDGIEISEKYSFILVWKHSLEWMRDTFSGVNERQGCIYFVRQRF